MVTNWALIVKIRIFAVNIQYFTRIQLYFDMNQAIQLQAHFGISVVYIIYGTKIIFTNMKHAILPQLVTDMGALKSPLMNFELVMIFFSSIHMFY